MAKKKPYSYHHLTPQTYMNWWSHFKDKVYTIEKSEGDQAVVSSTKEIAGE